jgi:hypothetical protein
MGNVMNPYITGIIVGLIALSRKSGSKSQSTLLNEDDFEINVSIIESLKKAKEKSRDRAEMLLSYNCVGANNNKIRFAMEEWLQKNPMVQFASDLLFVNSLDPLGEVILYTYLNMNNENKTIRDSIGQPSGSSRELHLISDPFYIHNLQVSSVLPKKVSLNSREKQKLSKLKEKAKSQLVGIAPFGEIAFLEKNSVPYNLKFKNAAPVNLWNSDQAHHTYQKS